MQVVQLRIKCESDWVVGTAVDVFDNHGAGAVDLTRKLNGRSVDCFPGVFPEAGFGQAPFGLTAFGGDLPISTFGEDDFGEENFDESRPRVSIWLSLPYVDGERNFSAVATGLAGNKTVGTPTEFAVSLDMEPPGAYDLKFSDYEPGADRLTFSFKTHVE